MKALSASPALAALRSTALAVLLIVASALVAPATLGYGEHPLLIRLNGPGGVIRCDRLAVFTAIVKDSKTNDPIKLQTVTWSIPVTQSSRDRLSDLSTTTDRKGRTTVYLTFGLVAGQRKVTAKVPGAADSVQIRCAGGLPETFVDLPDAEAGGVSGAKLGDAPATDSPVLQDGGLPASAPAPLLALVSIVAGLGILLRRSVRRWAPRHRP